MSDASARILELSSRIERIARHPDEVKRPLTRLLRPILGAIGWRPKIRVEELRALLAHVGEHGEAEAGDRQRCLDRAIGELDDSINAVEKSCVASGRPPIAYASCLRRILEVVARGSRVVDRDSARVVARTDSAMALPPLALSKAARAANHASNAQVRLLELQLGSVDHLLDAARAEPEILSRRRRFLEAARQVLLDTAGALQLDQSGVETRRRAIAEEITRIDRLEAAGVDPNVGLLHQARQAAWGGERPKLHAILVAIDGLAAGRGDNVVCAKSGALLDRISHHDRTSESARTESILASSRESFGKDVVESVFQAYAQARRVPSNQITDTAMLVDVVTHYLAPGQERATLAAALSVDGCFEVGGVLSPLRVVELETRLREVRYPTQQLVLLPARDVADLGEAIVDDPRMILLDLAAGRLMARRFVQEDRIEKPRTVMRGEARIFLLDGSTSMIGPRARMRDGILIAELATLIRRLEVPGRTTRTTLFYRYFNSKVGKTWRIDSQASALAAISKIAARIREGGTDIERALEASFALVREARASDPELARAQIVLVTDGEAPVSEDLIERERRGVEDLPIGLSVIALGEENAALRQLVATQRAHGERAFYHFIDDDTLRAIGEGKIDRGDALHLFDAPVETKESAKLLRDAANEILDELEAIGKKRDVDAIDALEIEKQARIETVKELGDEAPTITEGERARAEALMRDALSLEVRYARWFPPVASDAKARASVAPEEGSMERDDLEAVALTLATVAEVIDVTSGGSFARRADAIEILERLLPDAGLTPWRYEEIVRACASDLAGALAAVHRAVGGPTMDHAKSPRGS